MDTYAIDSRQDLTHYNNSESHRSQYTTHVLHMHLHIYPTQMSKRTKWCPVLICSKSVTIDSFAGHTDQGGSSSTSGSQDGKTCLQADSQQQAVYVDVENGDVDTAVAVDSFLTHPWSCAHSAVAFA